MSDMNEIFVKKDRKLIKRIADKELAKEARLRQIEQLQREIAQLEEEREGLIAERHDLYMQMPINMYRAYAEAHTKYQAVVEPSQRISNDFGNFFSMAKMI